MRTDSHRLAGTLVALGFVAGWFSASFVSPPAAATQARAARPQAPPREVQLPRIALETVAAPDTTPAATRNPFVFSDRALPARVAPPRGAAEAPVVETALDGAAVAGATSGGAASAPPWRVFGVASSADGHITAVISGGGDVMLVRMGDLLPDGSAVVAIDGAGMTVMTASGDRITLRLP